jgi:glycosyltransferase involved in cell wall biosynthesis
LPVQEQPFGDWELTVSDNASADETLAACRDFARNDKRIRVYGHDRNLGSAPNYNWAFKLSPGQYFGSLVHDDYLGPRFLESGVQALKRSDRHPLRRQTRVLSITGPSPATGATQLLRLECESSDTFWAMYRLTRRTALEDTHLVGAFNASEQVLMFEVALSEEFVPRSRYRGSRRGADAHCR